jgi:hypothetical protein
MPRRKKQNGRAEFNTVNTGQKRRVGLLLVVSRQEQRRGQRSAAGCAHRNPRLTVNLARTTLAAQLHHRLVCKAKAVQAARPYLTAEGVERQFARQRNALAAFDEPAALADLAKAERLEPGERLETKTIVELCGINVSGPIVGMFP